MTEIIHACPPDGSGLAPCCGKTPFELPTTDRMTIDPSEVTCGNPAPTPVAHATPCGPNVCGVVTHEGAAASAPESGLREQPARSSPLADVQGRCPACHGTSLFLGDGGYVTCSRLECPEPDAASTLLERDPQEPS